MFLGALVGREEFRQTGETKSQLKAKWVVKLEKLNKPGINSSFPQSCCQATCSFFLLPSHENCQQEIQSQTILNKMFL
jgi:hypothetical protein